MGSHEAFTATADMKVSGKGKKGDTKLSSKSAYLAGKMRTEMDLTKIQSAELPADAVAQMKQMGMDITVSILRPDLKKMLLVYPSMNAYVEMPLPKDEEASLNDAKVDTTDLGKETVDGHPCVKRKVTITDSQGKKQDFTTWNATDMKDFPVKLETSFEGQTITIAYKDIKFDKPDAKLFEAPSGFAKHSNMQALMMEQMQKMFKQ